MNKYKQDTNKINKENNKIQKDITSIFLSCDCFDSSLNKNNGYEIFL